MHPADPVVRVSARRIRSSFILIPPPFSFRSLSLSFSLPLSLSASFLSVLCFLLPPLDFSTSRTSRPHTRDPRTWFNASRAALLIYAPNMYTRLALATGATVKAPVPISYRPTSTGVRALASRIRTSHIMESGASTTILKGRARGPAEREGRGSRETAKARCTREIPNIDLFEISNSSLSCRGSHGNARRAQRARQFGIIRHGSVINSACVF